MKPTQQDDIISRIDSHPDVVREAWEFLEYANAKLSQCISVVVRETDERELNDAARELLRTVEWRRRIVRIVIKMVARLPRPILAKLDEFDLGDLVADQRYAAVREGFRAASMKFVSGPPPGTGPSGNAKLPARWVYDFTDTIGNAIRISLPQAIDDYWTTTKAEADAADAATAASKAARVETRKHGIDPIDE